MPTSKTLVERGAFVAALSTITKAIEHRNTFPILANVWLSVADDRMTLRGTDLDIEITTSIPATGALAPITAPAKTLLDIAKKLPAGAEIALELDGETLLVKAGRSRFKLATLAADGFPDLATGKFTSEFDADLSALMAPLRFAISNEETRYYLNGVFLHNVGEELRAVATDGHRLARVAAPTVGEIPSVIVPKKTVALLPAGTVHVELSDTKIRITQGDTVIVSKLIEGTFPDYERVTPKNNDKQLVADRTALLDAVERVSVLADPRGGRAIRFDVHDETLTLTVTHEGESASEDVPIEWSVDGSPSSDPFVIGFNAAYVSEIFRVATGEKTTLLLNDPGAPALIKGDDAGWLGVLMPMRVA